MKRYGVPEGMVGAAGMIASAIPTHSAVTGTSGITAIGGGGIARPSFLLTADIIFWMGATGIQPGVMIR
jgi:hypothetical protein